MKKHCLGCNRPAQIHVRDKKGHLLTVKEQKDMVVFHNKQCMKNYYKLVCWGGIPETW